MRSDVRPQEKIAELIAKVLDRPVAALLRSRSGLDLLSMVRAIRNIATSRIALLPLFDMLATGVAAARDHCVPGLLAKTKPTLRKEPGRGCE